MAHVFFSYGWVWHILYDLLKETINISPCIGQS